MRQDQVAYLALFSGVMCLAISPIVVSLAKVNGFTAAFYRVTIAAAVLLIPYFLQRKNVRSAEHSRPSRTITVLIAGAGGLIFALNNGFFNTAVTMVPVANAVFLVNTAVIWVGLVSISFFRERLSINYCVLIISSRVPTVVSIGREGVGCDTYQEDISEKNVIPGGSQALKLRSDVAGLYGEFIVSRPQQPTWH